MGLRTFCELTGPEPPLARSCSGSPAAADLEFLILPRECRVITTSRLPRHSLLLQWPQWQPMAPMGNSALSSNMPESSLKKRNHTDFHLFPAGSCVSF